MEIRTSLSKIADHSRPFANCCRRCRTDWALYWQKMIDDHILGIEKTWYEAAEKDKNAVQFHGVSYVREDRLQEPVSKAKEAHIYQVGMAFYFVDQAVSGGTSMFSPQQPMRNYPQPGPPRPMPNQRMMGRRPPNMRGPHLEHSSKVFSKPDNFFL